MPTSIAAPPVRIPLPLRLLALAALGLGLLAAPPPPAAAQGSAPATVTLRGRVTDQTSGQPVAAVFVTLPELDLRAYTDAEGAFSFPQVPAGTHRVVLLQLGYLEAVHEVTAARGAQPAELSLRRNPLVLERLVAVTSRMAARAERSDRAAISFGREELAKYPRPDLITFLEDRTGLRVGGCDDRQSLLGKCAWIRGEPQRVTLVLDEEVTPGGLDDLFGLPVRDLYRVEVHDGGGLVVAYTQPFMQQMLRRNLPLFPLSHFRRMAARDGGLLSPGHEAQRARN